jgi:hypothetical protein
MVGDLGFLQPNQNPKCLKVTMSPGFNSHLVVNTVVVGAATKVTPFGLLYPIISHNGHHCTCQRKSRTKDIPIDFDQHGEAIWLLHLCVSVIIISNERMNVTKSNHDRRMKEKEQPCV